MDNTQQRLELAKNNKQALRELSSDAAEFMENWEEALDRDAHRVYDVEKIKNGEEEAYYDEFGRNDVTIAWVKRTLDRVRERLSELEVERAKWRAQGKPGMHLYREALETKNPTTD